MPRPKGSKNKTTAAAPKQATTRGRTSAEPESTPLEDAISNVEKVVQAAFKNIGTALVALSDVSETMGAEDDEETPKGKAGRKAAATATPTRRKPKPQDEEDEDEDDDEVDDDDDDETDDDETDDEDDDWEDTKKPAKKPAKKPGRR